MWFCWHSDVYLLVPAWVCNVSAGTDPPKCSVSLSHFHFPPPPKCFHSLCVDYFSLGKGTCRSCNLSRRIHIWKNWAIFSYGPIWSPAAPVRCVHCSALVLVAGLVVWMSAEKGLLGGCGGAVSQPGGALCPCVVWWSGGGVLDCQPKLVFAGKRCQLTCFVYLWFPPYIVCSSI